MHCGVFNDEPPRPPVAAGGLTRRRREPKQTTSWKYSPLRPNIARSISLILLQPQQQPTSAPGNALVGHPEDQRLGHACTRWHTAEAGVCAHQQGAISGGEREPNTIVDDTGAVAPWTGGFKDKHKHTYKAQQRTGRAGVADSCVGPTARVDVRRHRAAAPARHCLDGDTPPAKRDQRVQAPVRLGWWDGWDTRSCSWAQLASRERRGW